MGTIKLTIDGVAVKSEAGTTILAAARQMGVEIPTICHQDNLKPSGNCRICVVEVAGSRTLVGACHTPIEAGMDIQTRSNRVLTARRANLELMLSGHTGECVSDTAARECQLHAIAADLEVGAPRFQVKQPRFFQMETQSPYVRRDMSKCILCRNCIRACREVAGQDVYAMAYRSIEAKVVVDCDVPLDKEVCKDCGICIDVCPTSALMRPEGVSQKTASPPAMGAPPSVEEVKNREKLLGLLKQQQQDFGYISEQAITKIAEELSLSIGDIYGVLSFYAFLSTKPRGRHIIRICKSLPCHMKDAPMIMESIEKTIGIKPGETTADGRFSFELANCIGACDQAPAMMINDNVFGHLTPVKISEVLESQV